MHNHAGSLAPIAKDFSAAGIECIALDYRGHGKSGGKLGHIESLESFVEDAIKLLKIVQEKYPDTPTFILGFSLGGLLANMVFLRSKLKIAGLVLLAPAIGYSVIS